MPNHSQIATPLLVAGLLAAPLLAPAQVDNPFGGTPSENPFGASPAAADNPFGAPPAASDSPFGAPPASSDSSFGAPASSDSPFGAPPAAAEDSPFGAPPASAEDNPFGLAPTDNPFAAPPENPFNTGGATSMATSPFSEPPALAGSSEGLSVSSTTEWRYVRRTLWNGETVVQRVGVPAAKALEWDEWKIDGFRRDAQAGQLAGFGGAAGVGGAGTVPGGAIPGGFGGAIPGGFADEGFGGGGFGGIGLGGPGFGGGGFGAGGLGAGGLGVEVTDPATAWATWAHYAEQLELWEEYVDRIVLVGTYIDQPIGDTITWPGEPAEGAAGTGSVPGGTGLDGGFGGGFGGGLDGGFGGGFGGGFPGGSLDAGTSTASLPFEDQVVGAYRTALDRLQLMEFEQSEFMAAFEQRLAERAAGRQSYREWLDEQHQVARDAVAEWARRYNGEVAVVAGVRYELYRPGAAPATPPDEARVVVTDYGLTPYDLLNPDGTVRGADTP